MCFSLAFETMQEELNLTIHIYTFIVHTSYMSVKSLDNVLISSNFPSFFENQLSILRVRQCWGCGLYIVSAIHFLNYNVQVTNDNNITYYNIK